MPKFLEFEIFENTVGVEVTGPLEAIGNILMNIVDGIGSLFD